MVHGPTAYKDVDREGRAVDRDRAHKSPTWYPCTRDGFTRSRGPESLVRHRITFSLIKFVCITIRVNKNINLHILFLFY